MATNPTKPIPKHTLEALKLAYGGAQFLNQGHPQQAECTWREAVELDPQCAPAWTFLTDYLAVHDRATEALLCLDRLISASEKTAETLYKLGDKAAFLKQYDKSKDLLNQALQLNPATNILLETRLLLSKIAFTEEDWAVAIDEATKALELDPYNLEALSVRQRSYFCTAYIKEDIADCRRMLSIKPDADRHSRLVFKLNYLTETTPESLYAESCEWARTYAALPAFTHTNNPDPNRRLKIGYVSPDFRNHAIMRLLPGVFENHNKNHFEIFAYSIDTKRDAVTDYVQSVVQHFVELPLARDPIADRVRADGIDILIDLAGHSMHVDGYLAFALKPAPVQATWSGVLATTGLKTMDYFIGDQFLPAQGTEKFFSEKIFRLPRIHSCYKPIADAGITPSPCLKNGYITFGSLNDLKKITRETVQLWAVILHLHPGSKLLMKYVNLQHEIVQRRFLNWFAEDGITTDRLIFEGQSKPMEYLATWNKVDIELDPFPYMGGTTTMDALWMGVPVISLAGRLGVACGGVSLLVNVGLPVASTPEQYIALAAEMAKVVQVTPNLRQMIRDKMLKSPLMDGPDMARSLEAAYRTMWRTWCEKQV